MSELTVVCSVYGKGWERRAERCLASAKDYNPDIQALLHVHDPKGPGTRFDAVLEAKTPWVYYLDADCLATGDLNDIMQIHNAGSFLVARQWHLDGLGGWSRRRFEAMCREAGLGENAPPIFWCGAYLVRREAAQTFVPRLRAWRDWYIDYTPPPMMRPHKKPDVFAHTLAVAESFCLDAIDWVGPEFVTWQGHDEPGTGLVHHFTGAVYRRLERQDKLEDTLRGKA